MSPSSPFSSPPVDRANLYWHARESLRPAVVASRLRRAPEAEGGCGVTGFACTIPVRGRHIYEPSIQMRNRGNGKGGGIAACGLVPEELGVSPSVLRESYILQIALLDPRARQEIEHDFVTPHFDIAQGGLVPTLDDHRQVPLLEVRPPDVVRYFVRVKPAVLTRFATEKGLSSLTEREIEDEFVHQNSVRLNAKFYASLGDKRAFVVSHGRNLIIMKIVGYAEAAVEYYRLHDTRAHVWIAHQRYPTKGRVWHPGGAHPFIGMNEALVHNGDFANYHSVSEYLSQRHIFPQFLTDTEVAAQLFDLLHRVYGYPIEYLVEALAATTELDFDRLPPDKRAVYRQIQAHHLHAAPDGPWFFIIARSLAESGEFQLVGITDTAMLRPQVFALQQGEVSIGLICSEKQAIDATLASLSDEDSRFLPVADHYWNARGGSHTDGGAFLLTVTPARATAAAAQPLSDTASPRAGAPSGGQYTLRVANKFGKPVVLAPGQVHCDLSRPVSEPRGTDHHRAALDAALRDEDAAALTAHLLAAARETDFDELRWLVAEVVERTRKLSPGLAIEVLTQGIDRRYPTGNKKRSSVVTILRQGLGEVFAAQPVCNGPTPGQFVRIGWESRAALRGPVGGERTLLLDAAGFAPEGPDCDSRLAVSAYRLGWRHLVHYNTRGTRFHGSGFGAGSAGLRIDCYDNPGDYLGSGMDGLEIHVHGSAQDQLLQIAKRGKLVVHGDVGQTFLYGAKGGEAYVLGNAAGRPLINAVGRPRVVINGTALDYLAESFMAGDPHEGGGFAIVNGLGCDAHGNFSGLELPYPGSNLLSLASGGAVYVRDPHSTLVVDQLNGGEYRHLTAADWQLILPYLLENERLFGVRVEQDLLTVDGVQRSPREVYRKVVPRHLKEPREVGPGV